MSTPLDRARARLASRTRRLAALKKRLAAARAAVAQTTRTIKRLVAQSKAGPWMPGVAHDPVTSIGPSTVGAKGGVLHTTEGLDFAAMDRVLKIKNACPHFLVGTSGQIKQYRPLPDAATALENPPGGVETNRKRVVQIEVCGFAAAPNWPAAQKKAVAKVMSYCAANGYPLKSTVAFTDAAHLRRLSGQAWVDYTGWCGHQHVPEQPSGHWDPGAVDVGELLAMARRIA
jgi:hypothetical protein